MNRAKSRPWSLTEIRELAQLATSTGRAGRLGAGGILRRFGGFRGRTFESIKHGIEYAHYTAPHPAISARAKNGHYLSKAEQRLFASFLRSEGRCWPNSALRKKFNISERTVERYRRKFCAPLPSHEECLRDPVYAAWWNETGERRLVSYRKGVRKKCADLQKKLEDEKFEILGDAGAEKVEKRTCKVCRKRFPATRTFFHYFEQKGRNGYLSKICLACPRKWRRKIAGKQRAV